jgi:polyribonucleotide nucleotidyltransferase
MAPTRVERPEDVVSEGQEVKVRVTSVDQQGKIGLSMLFGDDIKPESEGRPSGGDRGGFRGRDGGSGGGRGFGNRGGSGGGNRRDFGGRSDSRGGQNKDRNRR